MDLKALPKAELHCHLDGVLGPAMAREIRRERPDFPIQPEALERALPITDMDKFWAWWDVIRPIMVDVSRLMPVLEKHVEQLKAQNVTYAEVMIASGGVSRDKGRAIEQISAMRECADRLEAGVIQIEFMMGVGRERTAEEMEQRAEGILALHRAGLIVGVGLAGREIGYPVKPFAKTFARFHEAGLGIQIHAGEWCGPESVWDALEHGYPDRIGHGVSLFQDPRLIEIIQERYIHVEMCPTSNVKTGSVARIEEHPIRPARELRLPISVNTDDPGPFECSLESEYALLERAFGFDEDDWGAIYQDTLNARFQRRLRVSTALLTPRRG